MTEPAAKEAWVKAIFKYQESLKSRVKPGQSINIAVDGVINYGKDTYTLLKCDVAAKLGEKLSKTPEICDKVKPIDSSSSSTNSSGQ
jgi:predicted aspartyl protease